MVEINLTSNDGILGITAKNHPLANYRAAKVPVSLSTDDEGVSRSNLTTEYARAVRSTRPMTAQLLQEAAQVIPNQQLLINVVSKRVRQLGMGHRPLVEASPRASLTDIALKEIIAGKLTFEAIVDEKETAA